MFDVGRAWIWLRRCMYCRGFGIHSPWAYRFVRYVVNEHYPYYAYEELESTDYQLKSSDLRLCQFYFRLANFAQSNVILNWRPLSPAYTHYLQRGCRKSIVEEIDIPDQVQERKVELVLMSLSGDYREFYSAVADKTSEKSVIVLQGIHKNREVRRFWDEIKDDERTVTTFDLYYCGVVFYDRKRYKKHYIINF